MESDTMRTLANERLSQFEHDADTAGRMALSPSSRETDTNSALERTMSALLRCHWHQARCLVSSLPEDGTAGVAAMAMSAVLSRLISPGSVQPSVGGLSLPRPAPGTNANAWAAATVAMSLVEWCDRRSGPEPVTNEMRKDPDPVTLVQSVCKVSLGSEAQDLLCLSLALHARGVGDPMLGSFLLGKLSNVVTQLQSGARGTAIGRGVSPAAPAAAGLSSSRWVTRQAGADSSWRRSTLSECADPRSWRAS